MKTTNKKNRISKKNATIKDVFHAKTTLIDISDGEELIVLINEHEAMEYGISPMDKVSVWYKDKEIVLNADLTTKFVKPGQIGIFKDVYQKYNIAQ